jgi:FkbM family methyltransferase
VDARAAHDRAAAWGGSALTSNRSRLVRLMDLIPAPVARYARCSPIAVKLLAPIINPLLPDRASEITVRSGPARGIRLIIDPKNEKFYWAGIHELQVQQLLTRVLRPGSVFWDVGAHVGFFSCLAGRIVGESGLVLSFEPEAENRRRLLEAVRMNRLSNVMVRETAVGASTSRATLHATGTSTMWSLLDGSGDDGRSVEVPCQTLDDELRSGTRPPTLLKVDVEGAEVDVLEGAAALFAMHRPLAVVEFHSPETLDWARAILGTYEFQHLHELNWLLCPLGEAPRG